MKSYEEHKQITRLNDAMGLPRAGRLDIEFATKNNSLTGSCDEFMPQVIHCLLCEMPMEAKALLMKSKAWLERAIETREWEVKSKGAINKLQQKMYATIRWLHDGVHDQDSLDKCMADTMKWYQIDHPELVTTADIGFMAVTFIDAGAYQDLLSLAAPAGIDSIKCSGANEKQMALTLAAQALTQKFPEDKVQATVKKFLDKNVGKWLNDGHAVRAAEWMKVIYWKRGEAGITPFDAVRRCLAHVEH